jgi:heterodisulfide reductase subunit B
MKISYYPGCSMKTAGINFEKTAIAVLASAGVEVVELEKWYCCGVMFSMASDNLMHQLAPVRTLIRAKETGNGRLLTLCSMCYNTLRRAQLFMCSDEDKNRKINDFMDLEETEFNGNEVEVVHLLQLLDSLGPDTLGGMAKDRKKSLKIAPYYGCVLTRPKEVAIDAVEDPTIMERVLTAAGCEPVDFPFKAECCGSFQVVSAREVVLDRARKIVTSAVKNGAQMLVLCCPLCGYNLDAVQMEIKSQDSGFQTIPVLYFTQLLALQFGIDPSINDFSLHYVDPTPTLQRTGLL